jgi:ribosomal protein S18 acetylase RimI-like enzyme
MNPKSLSFGTTDEPSAAMLGVVDAGLDQYNQAAAPLGQVRPLAAFATDDAGKVVGGASGRTWGRCCELLQLWVASEHRGEGIGSQLLRDFERHARTRGCDIFYLTTLSFQAPDFYRRHGYGVLARIDGYPDGIAKYLMHKTDPA